MNFNNQQLLVISALVDGIFPRTPDSPAASDLPVPEMFVDIAKTWETHIFLATANALDIINSISLSIFSLPIHKLDTASLAVITNTVATNNDLKPFWEPFRMLIAIIYYALPPAYEAIGMPGPSIDNGGFTPDGYPV